jgi:alkylated DNA repair protein (DNA oxidative demethylase)
MLFGPSVPDGLLYRPDFVTVAEARALVAHVERLEFSVVEMRGVVARRRTVHYGWTYGYYSRRTEPGPPLPAFLASVQARAGAWAGIDPALFVEALITEYTPGAAIGWHRDAPMFGDVIAGVSLLALARMKFRPYVAPGAVLPAEAGSHKREPRRATHELELAPGSAYLLSGAARRDFEHNIPAVDALRYSITFRTLRR